MTKRKRTAADFPPEFLDAWELAAKGELRLDFESAGKAKNFRQQLHAFRKALVDENGQGPFAHWWNYDLVIEGTSIICRQLEWKKQIRAAKLLPSPKIQNPAPIVPASLEEDIKENDKALDQALAKLGYKS